MKTKPVKLKNTYSYNTYPALTKEGGIIGWIFSSNTQITDWRWQLMPLVKARCRGWDWQDRDQKKSDSFGKGGQELSQMNNYHSAVGTFSLTSRLLLLSGLSSLNRGQLWVASPLVPGMSSCFSVHSNQVYLHCLPVFLQSVTDTTSICLKVLLLQPLTKSP